MTEPLAVRYRPQKFTDMVGQRLTATVLSQMVAQQKVPGGFLFSGPSGVGKTTAARILAATLDPEVDPALSVVEVDAASNGGVADMRTLTESLRYSTGSAWRVVILDEAQSLTRDAFNALLKTLEEPPPGTVFVLVTTEPHKIPETVVTRLMEFEFRRVSPSEIYDRLVVVASAEQSPVTEELLREFAVTSDGSVRRALMNLEKASLAGLSTVEAWRDAVAVHDASGGILDALSVGAYDRAFDLLDDALHTTGHPSVVMSQITACLRDLLVLRAGGQITRVGAELDLRIALSTRIEGDRLLAASKILWDLKTKIRETDDPFGSTSLALTLVGEVFMRGRTAPVVRPAPVVQAPPVPVETKTEEPRRLTLAEMQGA